MPPDTPTARAANITLTFADVGLSGSVKVHDVWRGADLGSFTATYTAHDVAYLDTAFLRLSPA